MSHIQILRLRTTRLVLKTYLGEITNKTTNKNHWKDRRFDTSDPAVLK